jgi:hypothetical protein
MKKVSIVVLLATIAFFIVTASSAEIGTDFLFRQDTTVTQISFLPSLTKKQKLPILISTQKIWYSTTSLA